MAHTCATIGCGKPASMQCPTCLKQNTESFFCSQDCFKGSWAVHKAVHKASPSVIPAPNWPGFNFTGKMRPYPQTPRRTVPTNVVKPDYASDGIPKSELVNRGMPAKCLNDEEIEVMRTVCKLGREILDEAAKIIAPGVTCEDIDRVIHEATIERECYPSPLNYNGFPKSCCTSVNEIICHGIPDMYKLQDGDIVNVDVSAYKHGYHTDLNETLLVGNVDEEGRKLVRVTHECLQKAIEQVKPGYRYRDVGDVISKHAQANNLSVVRSYCGHGVGTLFHCAPNIPHYAKNKAVGTMKPGHVFTIEPMINLGTWQDVTWPDNWTSATVDGKRSAQFEHTLLVTDTGCEVLTARTPNSPANVWFATAP